MSILTSLDFNSREAFIRSFESASRQPEFRAVLLLLITNRTSNHAAQQAKQSWQQFEEIIEEKLGFEVRDQDLPRLLGKSCAAMIHSQV